MLLKTHIAHYGPGHGFIGSLGNAAFAHNALNHTCIALKDWNAESVNFTARQHMDQSARKRTMVLQMGRLMHAMLQNCMNTIMPV